MSLGGAGIMSYCGIVFGGGVKHIDGVRTVRCLVKI